MKRIIQDIVAQFYHKIVWKKSRLKPSRLEIGSTYNYDNTIAITENKTTTKMWKIVNYKVVW